MTTSLGSVGLYPAKDGTIFATFRAGDAGMPLEDLLPASGRGEGFEDFPVADYFDYAHLWFATAAQIDALNKHVRDADLLPGQTTKVARVPIDLKAYKLLCRDGAIDNEQLKEMFLAIAMLWEQAKPVAPIPALFHGLYRQGMPPRKIAASLLWAHQSGDVVNGALDLERIKADPMYQITEVAFLVYAEHQGLGTQKAYKQSDIELAMIAFANALNAGDTAEIDACMREARALFNSVLSRDADRLDAAVHVAIIDLVLSFSTDRREGFGLQLAGLGRLLTERHDQLGVGETPIWLKPRVDRETEWWSLLRLLRSVDSDIQRESWLQASKVMEQVLAVYDAERTVAVGSALHTLFAPRIEAAFVRRQGLAAHLHDLLATEDWDPPERSVAKALRERIAQLAEKEFPTRLDEENSAFPELSAVLQDRELLSQVPEEMARRLESALADKVSGERGKEKRDVQRICYAVADDLANAPDYAGEVRSAFDQLIQQVVAFCEDRQNADLAQLGKRGEYLRRGDAVENDLQRDLREWLRGNMPATNILPEVPGIAAGRSDLYVNFGDVQFVIELKRHRGVVDDVVARNYRAQAVAYQTTGPKLGMLGILELVDRSGPPPSLVECVWTNSYIPEGSDLMRHLVVFRVPGMLRAPSEMK